MLKEGWRKRLEEKVGGGSRRRKLEEEEEEEEEEVGEEFGGSWKEEVGKGSRG